MKKFTYTLILVCLLLATIWAIVQQYFSYVGPQLARKAGYDADLKMLEVDKEKLLLINKAVEERLRTESTTNFYYYLLIIILIAFVAIIFFIMWNNYDKRKESWARAVDGMFALQTQKTNGITWRIDPNKIFTSAIGVAESGEIAELPVSDKINSDRQLAYNKSVQTTRTAIAIAGDGQGIKYAATGKFLAGAYDKPQKMLSTTDGQNYIEVPSEPIPTISLSDAWEQSTKNQWIVGQSEIDGELCIIDLKRSIHIAVIGAPGVGKSASTGLLIAAYAQTDGYIVLCLDGKGGADWTQYGEYFDVQEASSDTFHLQFAEIAKEHNRRLAILREKGWTTIDDSKGAIKPVLVILEEFGFLMKNIETSDQTLYRKLLGAIVNLMKVSRATGIHFCIIDQTLSDTPNEIKGIIKMFIAYKLNGSVGNAVKLYYLDELADRGEFCSSNSPKNKFKAWHTEIEFSKLPIDKKDYKILPELPKSQSIGVNTDFTTKKMLESTQSAENVSESEEQTLSNEYKIIKTYEETKSLNKTCEAVYGKGKTGKYYADKIKPVLIDAGLLNGNTKT